MNALTPAQILSVWERGTGHVPVRQALILLAEANSNQTIERLAGLSIGERDARLIKLRALTFGKRFESVASCPSCGERLEFTFTSDEIVQSSAGNTASHEWSGSGYNVTFRSIASGDVLELPGNDDNPERALFNRCIVSATKDGKEVSAELLPDGIRESVVEAMSQADPNADIRIDMGCPSCGHRWDIGFDIASYFWREIDEHCRHLLREVHTLAISYGWRESEILSMSAWKRNHYIQMVTQ